MDWNNIDLSSPYERSQNIIDSLSFDTLLLEIQCNIKNINEKTITEQFETDLQNKIESAREVFKSNLKNILKEAQKERKIK